MYAFCLAVSLKLRIRALEDRCHFTLVVLPQPNDTIDLTSLSSGSGPD